MFRLTLSAIKLQLFTCLVVEVILSPLGNLWRGRTKLSRSSGAHQCCTRARARFLSNQENLEQVWALGPPSSQGRSSSSKDKTAIPVERTFQSSSHYPGWEFPMASPRGHRWGGGLEVPSPSPRHLFSVQCQNRGHWIQSGAYLNTKVLRIWGF